jgi:uncharacterized protein YkwD
MRSALRAWIGAALAGAAAAGWPGSAVSAPDACKVRPAVAEERTMNRLIAAQRRAERVPKVKGDAKLLRAGRAKSLAMAKGGRFAHSGALPWARGRAGGQNIAMAPSATAAFEMMLVSPGHRSNIVARGWRFAAVGAARSCGGQVFFTLNFLGPPVR